MPLLADVSALLSEVTDINAANESQIDVSVYIEDSAPSELTAHVRSVFASSNPNVRMTLSYIDKAFTPNPLDDVAVIVTGASKTVGVNAAALRDVGVPVMVVTLDPLGVARAAAGGNCEIPDGDIISPEGVEVEAGKPLDDEAIEALNEGMGRWIVSVIYDKRLAFARAFPFMRRSLAKDSIQLTALENAGIGLVPIIGGADLPIMTINQIKMTLQIASAYGEPLNKDRAKEIAFVLAGAYLSRGLVRRLVAAVPVLGFVFKTGVAYGTTTAVGYAILEYFEGGQDATGVANVAERVTESGTKLVAFAQEKAGKLSQRLPGANAE